ncbi:ferrous iron transport protein B [Maricaulis sp.]|uniref:ferrous iron transport protein B n=1 Tax=Maricaulis sp. TaxID=1486257 RepID=UPI003A95C015
MSRLRIALVGAPNSGKSTLFNGLTGGRAKVANYSGVTVETRTGWLQTPGGSEIDLIDLPGIYGLKARSTDERIAIDLLCNGRDGEAAPDGMLVLIDAAHLRTHLHTVLQMRAIGRPMIVVLNMIDLAERDGLKIDVERLQTELGVPVVTSRATRATGRADLLACLDRETADWQARSAAGDGTVCTTDTELSALQREARGIADKAILFEPVMNRLTRQIDQFVLHPVAGPLILAGLLFFMFQAVYSWSGPFMDALEAGAAGLGQLAGHWLPAGWFHDLIVDGIIAGVGSVVVFLPQIVILFLFILALEASGYMARAAVLMDELMLRVGLNGRAFIPLLSSFACAIPGIMSARTIDNERDRLTTIMVAPLMTCSARLPVYTLIIGAFIPPDAVGPFNLQGIVMFGLYLTGVVSAVTVAFILKRTVTKGSNQVLIMELPTYKLPNPRDFLLSLWGHVSAFLRRAGTIILTTSIILWFLASYPSSATSLRESYAGMIGSVLEKILAPIGFNLEIAIALVPGMAAREVAVGALGTVYAIQGGEENVDGLAAALQGAWSLPTALAFLAWYVFAPQCFATLATARRETNSWAWTGFMFGYLMVLAYVAAGTVFHVASWAGL